MRKNAVLHMGHPLKLNTISCLNYRVNLNLNGSLFWDILYNGPAAGINITTAGSSNGSSAQIACTVIGNPTVFHAFQSPIFLKACSYEPSLPG